MSSITIGGTLGELAEKAKKELKKLKIKDVNDFFEKLGNDIDHLPQDVKKAIKDTEEELKRLNINFNELLENGFDSMKEIFEKIPTPEEFAREMALSFANRVKEDTKDDTSIKLCTGTVGGLLVATGLTMKTASSGAPNPYADYLIISGPVAAAWGCTEAYK